MRVNSRIGPVGGTFDAQFQTPDARRHDQIVGRPSVNVRSNLRAWNPRALLVLADRQALDPRRSMVHNSNDASGTHCADPAAFSGESPTEPAPVQRIQLIEAEPAHRAISRFLRAAAVADLTGAAIPPRMARQGSMSQRHRNATPIPEYAASGVLR